MEYKKFYDYEQYLQEIDFKKALKILVSLLFLIGLAAAFYNKQIFQDAAVWFFRIANTKYFAYDVPHRRYSGMIVQIPTVIWSHLNDNMRLGGLVFNFSYFAFPFLALLGLKGPIRTHKPDLIYPVLQSFLLTVVPSWGFSNNIANEAIVISWFLLAYILVAPRPSSWVIFLLCSLLLFSYESSFLYYLAAGWILVRENKSNRLNLLILIILLLLQLGNFYSNIIPMEAYKHFKVSFVDSFKSPFFFLLLSVLTLSILSSFQKRTLTYLCLVFVCIICALTFTNVLTSPYSKLWGDSYKARVWSLPFSGLIFLAYYELKFRRALSYHWAEKVALLFVFIPIFALEASLLKNSHHLTTKINKIIREQDGCISMDFEQTPPQQTGSFNPNWSLPYISIALNPEKKNQNHDLQ